MQLFAELSEVGVVGHVSRTLVPHPLLHTLPLLRQVPAERTQLREHAAAVLREDIGGRCGRRVVVLIVRYLVAHNTDGDHYAFCANGIRDTLVGFINSNNVTYLIRFKPLLQVECCSV